MPWNPWILALLDAPPSPHMNMRIWRIVASIRILPFSVLVFASSVSIAYIHDSISLRGHYHIHTHV